MLMVSRLCRLGNNRSSCWLNGYQTRQLRIYNEYFKSLHDTRIIPDFIFGATTVIITVTTLRMGYIGYQYAIAKAQDFDSHCDRIITAMEKNKHASTVKNTINIQFNDNKDAMVIQSNDETKMEQFKQDLSTLLDNKMNKSNIKSYSIIKNA